MMKDPYHILGVGRQASPEEIKEAYRRLARAHHPDLAPGNPHAEDRFKDISTAYDTLSDPGRRKAYDNDGIYTTPNRATAGNGAKGAFDRFFRQRQQRNNARGTTGAKVKIDGTNITYSITIDFLDAVRGMSRRISATSGKDLAVTIPPGTEDGQTLRLKGQGTTGIGGGKPGDALVEVAVLPHPNLRQQGRDLHSDLAITLNEAVLGAKIEVETIHGAVQVAIPVGANTDTRLRLKGKGVCAANGAKGDHYLHLKVMLPEKPDGELTAFLKTWAGKNPYTVKRTK